MTSNLLIDLDQPARVSVLGARTPDYLAGIFSRWSRISDQAADLCLALGVPSTAPGTFKVRPDGGLCVRGAYKLAAWQAELRSDAHPWDMAFRATFYQEWLAARMIVFPFLQRALLTQGRFLLPASVAQWKEHTLAFLGPGGGGKTTLLLACCAAGARFVGDDFVVASRNGTVQGLGDLISIKAAALAENALLRARLTARQRTWAHVCAALERFTRRGIVLSLHVLARQLFGNTLCPEASQSVQAILVEPVEGTAPSKTHADPSALSRAVMAQLRYWDACFGDLIALQRTVRGEPSDVWDAYRAQLDDFLRQSQCWRLCVSSRRGWVKQALPLLAG